MQTIPILIILSLFFNGCSQKAPKKEIEYVYVKTKPPRQTIFKKPQSYEITDLSWLDDTFIKVNGKQLKMASNTSQNKSRIIWLYEKQAIKFNKDFVDVK